MDAVNFVGLDKLLGEIVEIFNLDGVELVRLSGLKRHAANMNVQVDDDVLRSTITKLRAAGIIHWRYALTCPHCGELSWQVVPRPELRTIKQCDTCATLYVPEPGVTLTQIDPVLRLKHGWPVA